MNGGMISVGEKGYKWIEMSVVYVYIYRADMMDGRKEGKSKSDRTRDEVFSHIQNILLQENLKRPPYCVISYTKTYHILIFYVSVILRRICWSLT